LSTDAPEWTRTQVVYNGPLERFGHAGVWDGMRQRMIVQGGTPDNAATLKDTRALAYVDDVATATATDAPSATVTASATVGTSVIPTASATSTAATPTSSATPGTTPTGQTPAATDEATATATQPGIATATPAGTETRLLYLPTLLTH